MKTIKANAVCATCGTTDEDNENGFCKNGHDDWLELIDDANLFIRASENLNVSVKALKESIKNNISIEPIH